MYLLLYTKKMMIFPGHKWLSFLKIFFVAVVVNVYYSAVGQGKASVAVKMLKDSSELVDRRTFIEEAHRMGDQWPFSLILKLWAPLLLYKLAVPSLFFVHILSLFISYLSSNLFFIPILSSSLTTFAPYRILRRFLREKTCFPFHFFNVIVDNITF